MDSSLTHVLHVGQRKQAPPIGVEHAQGRGTHHQGPGITQAPIQNKVATIALDSLSPNTTPQALANTPFARKRDAIAQVFANRSTQI